jgi:hypothetical protein
MTIEEKQTNIRFETFYEQGRWRAFTKAMDCFGYRV